MNESPIFSKTYDFLAWLLPALTGFPKEQRFRLAQRIEESAFAFHTALLKAARSRQRRAELQTADLELEKLRVYLRLAQEINCLSFAQYEHAARQSTEIGKLLGGWLKSTPASTVENPSTGHGEERPAGRVLEQ